MKAEAEVEELKAQVKQAQVELIDRLEAKMPSASNINGSKWDYEAEVYKILNAEREGLK